MEERKERVVIEVDKEVLLKQLERLRREKGYTYKDLASGLGVSQAYIYQLLRGDVKHLYKNRAFQELVNLLFK